VMIQTDGDPWSIRVVWIFVGALISGLVGWASSLYNHYRDSRKHHLEELKQQVLEPLRTATLAPTLLAAFDVAWGPQAYNTNVRVSEYPVTHGLVLQVVEPETTSDHVVEKALLQDARKNHYVHLISSFDKFSQSVAKHSRHRRELVEELAKNILAFSGLPAHPTNNNGPYIMQLNLALVVYGRLMEFGEAALKIDQHPDGACLSNGGANWAKGQPGQMKDIMKYMDGLIDANRERAAQLRSELAGLRQEQNTLADAFSYEIAAKRLPGACDLVPFVQL
jgi:hypothetical protein